MCKVTKAIAHIFQAGAGIWEGVRHNTMLQSVRFLGAGVSAQDRARKIHLHPLPDPPRVRMEGNFIKITS